MNKTTIGIMIMLIIASIGIVSAEMQEQILSINSHESQTEFDTNIYFNGFDTSGESTIVSITALFDNGDSENIDMDLHGHEKAMSHGIMLELYSQGIDNGLTPYQDGMLSGSITIKIATDVIAPTPVPTPVPTPSPTATPTPTPTPTPQPGVVKINVPAPTATPAPREETSFSAPYGTIRFRTVPSNATVYINGEPLKQKTPVSRDFEPNGYNISIVLDGYQAFDKKIVLRNLDDIDIDVKLEPVEPEVTPEVVMSVVSIPEKNGSVQGATQNTTVETPAKTSNDSIFDGVWLPVGIIIIVAVAGIILVYRLPRKDASDVQSDTSDEEEDASTADKILGLKRTTPLISNDEMARMIGVTPRSIERNIANLKKKGEWPY